MKHHKKQSYHELLLSLRDFQTRPLSSPTPETKIWPELTLVIGSNDYFRQRSSLALRHIARDRLKLEVESFESKDPKLTLLGDMLIQEGIFGATLYHIQSFDKLISILKQTRKHMKKINQYLLVEIAQNELNKSWDSLLDSWTHECIFATPPSASELPKFIQDMARKYQLFLDPSCAPSLIESCGAQSYDSIENEIKKLSLIFLEKSSVKQPLSKKDIEVHLKLMREDHVFELDRLLLESSYAKAALFVEQLLRRGESAIALVGVFARHARIALQTIYLKSGASQTPPAIPPIILKNYQRYTHSRHPNQFLELLRACQVADATLKSQRRSEHLEIINLIAILEDSSLSAL